MKMILTPTWSHNAQAWTLAAQGMLDRKLWDERVGGPCRGAHSMAEDGGGWLLFDHKEDAERAAHLLTDGAKGG